MLLYLIDFQTHLRYALLKVKHFYGVMHLYIFLNQMHTITITYSKQLVS